MIFYLILLNNVRSKLNVYKIFSNLLCKFFLKIFLLELKQQIIFKMFYKSFLRAYTHTHTQLNKINTLYRQGVILNEKLSQIFL